MDIYLQPNDNVWYYFGYTRGVMQTLSTNTLYLDAIKEIKNRKRKIRAKRGETSYIYLVSTNRKMGKFLRRVKQANELIPDEDNLE